MPYEAPPPPAVGSSTQGDKYLGVPDDYVTDYRGSQVIPGDLQMRPDLHPLQVHPTYETKGPQTTSAIAAVASLPPESMARLQIKMARAGLIGPSTQVTVGRLDDSTLDAYKELLGIANRYGMSDTDALSMLESDPTARPGTTGGDLAAGRLGAEADGPTTHTSTSTQNFTPLDAKSIAEQTYQDALGRAATTPKERRALRAALNAYAQAHPSVSTTVTGTDGNSTTTSSGGIDSAGVQQIATDQARANPHYAEVQASTTYFNALQQALGPTAQVG